MKKEIELCFVMEENSICIFESFCGGIFFESFDYLCTTYVGKTL